MCVPRLIESEKANNLKDSYILPTSTTIAFKGGLESSEKGPSEPNAKAGSSRKWHERFARARRR